MSINESHAGDSRRSFLKKATGVTLTIANTSLFAFPFENASPDGQTFQQAPWYRRVTRWGQTNITEKDPIIYDIKWWRNHWKKTHTKGVIINAGGIIAYYPTKVPLHYKAEYLQGQIGRAHV